MQFRRSKLTRRAAISSEAPVFSWEMLLLARDRRSVGEPVEAVADILIYLFRYPREEDCRRRQMIRASLEERDRKSLTDAAEA
jgi:hypothetical protein